MMDFLSWLWGYGVGLVMGGGVVFNFLTDRDRRRRDRA